MYLRIFWRGWLIVALTASNVVQIAAGHDLGAFVVGTAISGVWWRNAHAAAHRDCRLAWLVYGLGAGCGTVSGIWVTRWWYS